jgi:type IV pilus assembly protein PilM
MNLDWKKLLKLNQNKVLGLDIGSSEVKMVQLHKGATGYTVTAAEIVDISEDEDDNNRKDINTVKAIHKCLESSGIQTRFAVCGVSGPEVAVRHFKFPLLPPDEIKGAVLLEATQVCPFNIDDSTVDYKLMPNGEDKNSVNGVLVAATNKVINNKAQLVKNASLDCVLMDVDGLALLNCFNECENGDSGKTTSAILNIGSSYTNLAIMSDNNRPSVRNIAYTGDDTLVQIAVENGISKERTRKILFGQENPTEPTLNLGESLDKACRKLIADVTETLRYYTAQEKSTAVKKILVCGDFALAEGFVELLDSRLPVEAVLWNPFDKMRCNEGHRCRDILQKRGPALAVAAGLAMRSI